MCVCVVCQGWIYERGRSVSLMQGVWGHSPQEAIWFMPNARFRAYLSEYMEVFNQICGRGCGECNSLVVVLYKVLK